MGSLRRHNRLNNHIGQYPLAATLPACSNSTVTNLQFKLFTDRNLNIRSVFLFICFAIPVSRAFSTIITAAVPVVPATVPPVPAMLPAVPVTVRIVAAMVPIAPVTVPIIPAMFPDLSVAVLIAAAKVPIAPVTVPVVSAMIPMVPVMVPVVPAKVPIVPVMVPIIPVMVPVVPVMVRKTPKTGRCAGSQLFIGFPIEAFLNYNIHHFKSFKYEN